MYFHIFCLQQHITWINKITDLLYLCNFIWILSACLSFLYLSVRHALVKQFIFTCFASKFLKQFKTLHCDSFWHHYFSITSFLCLDHATLYEIFVFSTHHQNKRICWLHFCLALLVIGPVSHDITFWYIITFSYSCTALSVL